MGNGDSHLHWHLFPRSSSDGIKGPVWWLDRETMFSDEAKLVDEELELMKEALYKELVKLTVIS